MKKIYKTALVFLSLLLFQTLTIGADEKKMKNTIIGDSVVSRANGEYRIFLNSNKDTANFYSFKNLLSLNLITKIQFSPSQETKDGDSFALKSNRHVKNIWIKAESALDKSPIFYTKPTTDMKDDFYYIESSFWDSIFGKRQLPNFIELGWNYYEK